MNHPKPCKIHRNSASRLGWGAALLLLCLAWLFTGCSGEVYHPDGGELTLGGGDGASTGEVLEIPAEDPFEGAPHVLRAEFLQTGKSDAILIRADGVVILVDTGEAADSAAISTALAERGITVIHHMILTHFDNDHIGSAAEILQDLTVEAVYMPDYVRDSALYRRLTAALEGSAGTAVHRLTETMTLSIPNGELRIHPTRLYEAGLTLGSDDSHAAEENNYSLITELTFGERRLLLMGDAEQDRLVEFLEDAEGNLAYDLIKIPHHGSYDKALGDLLRGCGGLRYCVVHAASPSEVEAKLVTAMRSVGAAAYFTYNGTVSFATDGVNMVLNQG